MRIWLLTTLLLNASLHALGQQNVFPDIFATTPGVLEVVVTSDCLTCKPERQNQVIAKYGFDSQGVNTTWATFCENEPCGLQKFNYQNGQLQSYENYSTHIGHSINGVWVLEWQSDQLTQEVIYKYKDGKLFTASWVDGVDDDLFFEITYSYDQQGRLMSEEIVHYPRPEIGGYFGTNSVQLSDQPWLEGTLTYTKSFEYQENRVTVQYKKEELLSGVEYIELNQQGEKVKSTLEDASGNQLSLSTWTYNAQAQLVERTTETNGIDGFGNSYDISDPEREVFDYDDSGRLITSTSYSGGVVFQVFRYTYK